MCPHLHRFYLFSDFVRFIGRWHSPSSGFAQVEVPRHGYFRDAEVQRAQSPMKDFATFQ